MAETAEAMINARERKERKMSFFLLREEGWGANVACPGWSSRNEEPTGSEEGSSLP